MSMPARIRDRLVLEMQIAELTRAIAHAGSKDLADFHRGAAEALRWVTVGGPGPLTGCLDGPVVSVQAVARELAVAEDLIYGRPSRRRSYGMGVEHALMWAQYALASPPV
jgi:hypothetical protein